MPLSLRRGRVTAVVGRAEGLARIEVDGTPCVAFPFVTGPVALGDDVVVNVQGRELELGSGGFDVLYANLTRGLELAPGPGAHVMKLPYTPLQLAVRHAEEDGSLAETLAGLPVVCCSLHSQLAPVCAALAGVRVAYLQLPGGSLPVAHSDAVRDLRGTAACRTTRRRCSGSLSVLSCSRGPRDVRSTIRSRRVPSTSMSRTGARRVPACRFHTWAVARTTIRGSSRPPSPPGAVRVPRTSDGRGRPPPRPGGRARYVEHVRRRCPPCMRGGRRGTRCRLPALRFVPDVRRSRGIARDRARYEPVAGAGRDEDLVPVG